MIILFKKNANLFDKINKIADFCALLKLDD